VERRAAVSPIVLKGSRFSGGVRMKPQNTGVIAGASSAAISRSMCSSVGVSESSTQRKIDADTRDVAFSSRNDMMTVRADVRFEPECANEYSIQQKRRSV
jgi:hypothetical protein